jgi:hypothetical protein
MNSKEDEHNQNTFVLVPHLIFEEVMMNGSGIAFLQLNKESNCLQSQVNKKGFVTETLLLYL